MSKPKSLRRREVMGKRSDNLPEALSEGQQQRVAVARALANEPNLILADEPTAALDSHRGRQVMELFRKVAHEHGAGVIVVSRDYGQRPLRPTRSEIPQQETDCTDREG